MCVSVHIIFPWIARLPNSVGLGVYLSLEPEDPGSVFSIIVLSRLEPSGITHHMHHKIHYS